MTVDELRTLEGVSSRYIRKLIEQGKLKAVLTLRTGTNFQHWEVDEKDAERWMSERHDKRNSKIVTKPS